MRKTIFLFVTVLVFAVYLVKGRHDGILPRQEAGVRVSVQAVSTTPARIPKVEEIDYFETDRDVENWIGRHGESPGVIKKRSARFVSQGKFSMEVDWRLKRWGEIVLLYFPEDWQRYSSFAFDVYSPADDLFELELRVGDHFDKPDFEPALSRYAVRRTIRPGLNRLRFSIAVMGKVIDVASARKIIRLRALAAGRLFYIDNMRLER